MDALKRIFLRKEFYIALLLIVIFVVYGLFFKPNPWLRINTSRTSASSESALSIQGPTSVDGVGKNFNIKISMDTMGNAVNAVQSYLTYDPKVLEIVSTNTEQSFCKFYPENSYDSSKGIVKLSCGSPYPGFRGVNTVEEIVFMPKAIQTTTLALSKESMVLANDGKGTNLLKSLPSIDIKINAGL